MSIHTEGPWSVDVGARNIIIRDSVGNYLAEMDIGAMDVGFAQAFADASIIAASPLLLDALIAAREALSAAVIAASGGMFDADTVGKHLVIAQIDAALIAADVGKA